MFTNFRAWIVFLSVALCAVVDVTSGVFVRVDMLHVLAVSAAAWWIGVRFAVAVGALLTLIRPLLCLTGVWAATYPMADVAINAALGAITMLLAVIAVVQVHGRLAARAEVMQLRGLLPICSFCKRIRTDENAWQRIEQYICEHSDAHFTHGVCPACAKHHYGLDLNRSE